MTIPLSVSMRCVAVASALKPLGLDLLVAPAGAGFKIAPSTGDLGDAQSFETIDAVEAWIADHRPTPAAHQIAAAREYIKGAYGTQDAPLPGTMTLEYRHPKPIEQRRAPRVGDDVHYVSHGSPVREDGSQAYKSVCRAAKVTAVYDMDPVPEHGVPYVSLFVMSPNGTFHDASVRYDGGTFAAPPREAAGNEPLPQVTCADLTYQGGSWHWGGDQ